MESIREIMKRRDGVDDDSINVMFDEVSDGIGEGVDPEDALAETFGLEPDYLFDDEMMAATEKGFALRRQV